MVLVWGSTTVPKLYHEYIWAATWDFQQCGMCDQQRLRPVCAYAQSDQSLCLSLEYYMNIKLLNQHNLEFLSLKEGYTYTGSSESIHVKMPHCWKSHVAAQLCRADIYKSNEFSSILSKISSLYLPTLSADNLCRQFVFRSVFVWFDSLRPINNFSVKQGQAFWVEPVLS